MRFLIVLSLLLALVPASFAEKVKPQFDGRDWEIGWSSPPHKRMPGMVYEEYVLKGESVQAWTELVTVQFFPDLQKKASQQEYVEGIRTMLKKNCPEVFWKDIRVSETDSLYEWSIKSCKVAPDQSELTRVIRTDKGVYVFHYASKTVPMPAETRDSWIKVLDEMKIEEFF